MRSAAGQHLHNFVLLPRQDTQTVAHQHHLIASSRNKICNLTVLLKAVANPCVAAPELPNICEVSLRDEINLPGFNDRARLTTSSLHRPSLNLSEPEAKTLLNVLVLLWVPS